MIEILTGVSLIAGGLLVILLLLSILGGLDFDLDVSSTEVDSGGGLGLVKGLLTFVSVSSWMVKVLLASQKNIIVSIVIGVICGALAIMLLSYILKLLLKNEENVNWELDDALFQTGQVYLKIPQDGEGIVNINIKGVKRELKAKTNASMDIATGSTVRVIDLDDQYVVVELEKS